MNRYNNLNGFRAFCAIGIALMHILANISPTPHLHNITPVIEWFTNFVFLFFIIEEFYKLKYCSTVVYMVPRA